MTDLFSKLSDVASRHGFHSYVSGSSLIVVIPYTQLGMDGEEHVPVRSLRELLVVLGY